VAAISSIPAIAVPRPEDDFASDDDLEPDDRCTSDVVPVFATGSLTTPLPSA